MKFGPLEKKGKERMTAIEMKFSEEQPGAPFFTTKGMKKFWKSWK